MKRRFAMVAAAVLAVAVYQIQKDDAKGPPTLGAGLPAEPVAADIAFDARIREKFPVGSSEADLISAMKADEFVISQSDTSAYVQRTDFPCEHSYQINWDAAAGVLTAIDGQFKNNCD